MRALTRVRLEDILAGVYEPVRITGLRGHVRDAVCDMGEIGLRWGLAIRAPAQLNDMYVIFVAHFKPFPCENSFATFMLGHFPFAWAGL